jgi:segregation and condensation protein A
LAGSDEEREQTEAERIREETLERLGPDVRLPGELPAGYTPSESVRDPLMRVDIDRYAGPLDLLLYLIRRHEVDVLDIPIKFITQRYMQLLEDLRTVQIDVASEFLVLAAELTHIKSKMLLPAKEGVSVEEATEDEEQGDPRAELVRRLLEYQKYRDAAAQLADRDQLGRDVFARVPPPMEAADVDPGLKSVSVFRLVELMARLMRKAPASSHEISYEHYSISERIQFVLAFGEAQEGKFTLSSLLEKVVSRSQLVVTFIAVLEMTKLGIVKLFIALDEVDEEAEEELPAIRIHLTGKRFEGQLVDDYQG